jgi:hypothetical protein
MPDYAPAFPAYNLTTNIATVTNAPTQSLWANYDTISWKGNSTITSGSGFVTRYIEHVVYNPMGGVSTSPQAWAAVISTVDLTNKPSSQAGLVRTAELDMEVSGADDYAGGLGRIILSINGFPGRNYTGTDTHIANAVNINQAGGSASKFSFGTFINIGGVYTGSGIDLSSAQAQNNAPALRLGVNQRIMLDSTNGTGGAHYIYSDGVTMHLEGVNIGLNAPTGFSNNVGFFSTLPQAQQVLSYSRSGAGETSAVAAIRQALAAYGLIKDSTTA